jgi:NAD-dependent dihydropyrimidine dehydrogenase PreA subunit
MIHWHQEIRKIVVAFDLIKTILSNREHITDISTVSKRAASFIETKEKVCNLMAYIITSLCIGQKDASCVDVCPVDCIHPTPQEPDFDFVEHLYVDPNECIDCGACEPACPVSAVLEESAVPQGLRDFIKINADYFNQ